MILSNESLKRAGWIKYIFFYFKLKYFLENFLESEKNI